MGQMRSILVALAALVGLAVAGAARPQTQPPAAVTAPNPERTRLLQLQRDAVNLLTRAALREAGQRLEALGADPAPGTTSPLDAPLRAELRRAAKDIAGATNTAPYLALLERVRVQLEGDTALGLSLQGSYSQAKVKEPA